MVKKSVWFLVFSLLAASCLDEPDCFSLNNYIIGISFKKLADSSIDTAEFMSIRTAEPNIIFSEDTISRIILPLNYFENETSFLFESPDTTRILRLGYSSKAQFVSENCGERFVLSDLRVLETSFDSVRVLRDTPARDAGTIHIEIFQ
jgi:hypothetical protein